MEFFEIVEKLLAAADWKVRAPFLTPPTANRDRAKILALRPVMG